DRGAGGDRRGEGAREPGRTRVHPRRDRRARTAAGGRRPRRGHGRRPRGAGRRADRGDPVGRRLRGDDPRGRRARRPRRRRRRRAPAPDQRAAAAPALPPPPRRAGGGAHPLGRGGRAVPAARRRAARALPDRDLRRPGRRGRLRAVRHRRAGRERLGGAHRPHRRGDAPPRHAGRRGHPRRRRRRGPPPRVAVRRVAARGRGRVAARALGRPGRRRRPPARRVRADAGSL
ncbi:MAG: Ribulose-5-phosphate 4-epimerase and related epimerases and aldolases, partial [uncultured Actinomycetospora sp.]